MAVGQKCPCDISRRPMILKTFEKKGMVGPDFQDKDAMIFPEKINGKVAFLHRIEPNVQLAYFDDLDHLLYAGGDLLGSTYGKS